MLYDENYGWREYVHVYIKLSAKTSANTVTDGSELIRGETGRINKIDEIEWLISRRPHAKNNVSISCYPRSFIFHLLRNSRRGTKSNNIVLINALPEHCEREVQY